MEALDFLQLQYKPPFPLDGIISPSVLERYDRLFQFLLKLFRMQYIASQLFRDGVSKTSFSQGINRISQRFRIEAHHFITAICAYIFHVSIHGNWYSFQQFLDSIERNLKSNGSAPSIESLREQHAKTLDRISHSCMLKRRQKPLLTLLYGTFEPILLFAKTTRIYARREQRIWSRMREEMEDNTRILYTQFIKKAGMFIRVLEELDRKRGMKSSGDREEGYGVFADLLTRLDGSYFDR
jgi:hypothetical protein